MSGSATSGGNVACSQIILANFVEILHCMPMFYTYRVQCIHRLKAERRQLQEQVELLEEKLDKCCRENAELQQLRCLPEQLRAKTAECEKLAACNVGCLRNWCYHC